ncbi:MAG: hypothetical protein KatS3mg097_101 [Candidatus Parcubacteria bacterium]|nr:MAG: hypothetical protein KatS3mg097_101 [Candidatus Parcubacteria bacterium]
MTKNLFDNSNSVKNYYKLSRTKIELFIECPRCFYFDIKLGITRPPGFPFTLNNAVDVLLKKEFDSHRFKNQQHPLMKQYKLDLLPYDHKQIDEWRNRGIFYLDKRSNFLIYGKVDDVWVDRDNRLYIVDYKATSTSQEISLEGGGYKDSYKREVEIYQWLFKKNNFNVSSTAYFVYVNALKNKEYFDGKLEFDVKLLAYEGNDAWIENVLIDIFNVLSLSKPPLGNKDCDFCKYIDKLKIYL